MRNAPFKSQRDGFQRAHRTHMCTECRHLQKESWNKDPCPKCSRVDTRQYFMSRKEQERAAWLLTQRDLGKIRNLRFQPRYDLAVNGLKVCTYVADAEYVDSKGKVVVEDVKPRKQAGLKSDAKIKIALFNALHRPLTVTFYK